MIYIRPIRRTDWQELQAFHSRLSDHTVRERFHAGKKELTEPLAHRLTDLDGHDNVALVATEGARGPIVGVARYARVGAGEAEVAFVVEDAHQGQGIGGDLMRALRKAALDNGIGRFLAEVLPGNTRMMRLLAEAGLEHTTWTTGECMVTVDLTSRPPCGEAQNEDRNTARAPGERGTTGDG